MMGCSSSKIHRLPAVSLCRHRCKFAGDALCFSYAFADAHAAYLHSLTAVGASLSRFSDQKIEKSDAVTPPEHDNSSSNSDYHLDFPSDSDDETEIEGFGEKEFAVLHSVQNPGFRGEYFGGNGGLFQAAPLSSEGGGSAWKTPPPPPAGGSNWGFLNFFDAYERYDLSLPKEEIQEIKNQFENEGKKHSKDKEQKSEKREHKSEKKDAVELEKKSARSSPEILREIEAQFERAAESGNELLKILDTGNFRYNDKNSIYQSISWKKLQEVIPSVNGEMIGKMKGGFVGEDEEEMGINGANLSSTLKKLSMWEKKLYDEVKAEEKLQIVLERSWRQIKAMAEKGGNGVKDKVDSAGTLIKALSTKIKVAIQVIDNTSITINKLRDEELWPFITQLIHKQLEMWKAMLECHKCQSEAIVKAKSLDEVLSNRIFNESHLESAIHLKIELQNWNLNFSSWITAQKCFAKAINNWLTKCGFSCQPEEENPHGIPVIFSFCNRWSKAVDRMSEMEVINAMNGLTLIVNNVVQTHYMYLQQRLPENKSLEKRMKALEKKEREVQRVLEARGKTFASTFSSGVHRSDVAENGSLEFGLKQIFKVLDRFSADNVKMYEELCATLS